MPLKGKAVTSALAEYEGLFQTTGDTQYAWLGWQLARHMCVPAPEWVLTYVDKVSIDAVGTSTRSERTQRRYAAALMELQVAIEAHQNRTAIRDVAKQLGQTFEPSRRDHANLSAIAERVANANGVSKNRLLAAYRAERKGSRERLAR